MVTVTVSAWEERVSNQCWSSVWAAAVTVTVIAWSQEPASAEPRSLRALVSRQTAVRLGENQFSLPSIYTRVTVAA